MASSEPSTIELPRLNIGRMEVTLVGDSPLIVNAWSHKAKRAILDKHMKKAKGGREAKDPYADFRDSLYVFETGNGGYGFPSVAFKAAAVTAVTSVSGITKVAARQAFHVAGDQVFVKAALENVLTRQDLVRIEGVDPVIREDMVKISMGTADIRYRGEFWPWWVVINVRFNAGVLSSEQILNLFNHAGFGVGVGEWRSERDGGHGMFHCAEAGEVDRIKGEILASSPVVAKQKRASLRRAA